MSNITVSIDNASYQQLAHFITSQNLDIPRGSNAVGLRARIRQGFPDLTEITVPDDLSARAEGTAAKPKNTVLAPAADVGEGPSRPSFPSGRAAQHFRYDPKVRLEVLPSSDPTRAKDVQVAVQGDVILIRRGREVEVPYRFYLALNEAVEQVARDTDQEHPESGLPIKEWVEQKSYPFSIISMPSNAEIDAWHERMAKLELS